MSESNGTDKKDNSLAQLPRSTDLWISRAVGGGVGGLLIAALWMILPSVTTYMADYKQIRLAEIQARIEQLNQQLTSCVSDLKDCRSELRDCRK